MRYKIVGVDVPLADGTTDECPRIEWMGTHDMSADAVDQVATDAKKEGGTDSATVRGKLLISSNLGTGRKLTRTMFDLAEKEGISESTLQRSARALNVKYVTATGGKYKKGCHEPCYWELPASPEVKARIRESNTTLDNVKEL